MLNRLIAIVVRQRVLVVLGLVVLTAWGAYAWRQLPLDAYPELTNNQVQILTEVPGLSPVEVERLVTYPVEISMASLPGVIENRSLSQFGLSVVTLVFEEDVDPYFARQLVFERLSRVRRDLPAQARAGLAPLTTALGEVYQYAVSDVPDDGRTYDPRTLRTLQDWVLAPELRTVAGVVEANALGGFVKQYHVRFDPGRLVSHGLTLEDAYAALEASNQNTGGHYVERRDEQFVVRGIGLLGAEGGDVLGDIRRTVLASRSGTPVLVEDVATVEVGQAVRYGGATMDGAGETVMGIVLMRRGANAQEVVARVQAKMDDLKAALPPGVTVEPFYNRNTLTGAAIDTVTTSLLIGGALVLLVLFGFLGDARSALIVSLTLPLTALATFVLMDAFGFSANLMSLGGLAIGLGMFVDGAIVMVENVHRLRAERPGVPLAAVVVQAGQEVARPIAFAVGVVVAVFLPLFGLQGLEGRMFRPMAFTVTFALLAALALALTMAPALSSYLLKPGASPEGDASNDDGGADEAGADEAGADEAGARAADGTGSDNALVRVLKRGYGPLLDAALRHRWATVAAAALVLAGGAFLFLRLGTEFAPPLEEGSIAVQVTLPPSASLATAQRVQTNVEQALLEFPEVTSAVSKTGRPAVATDPMTQNLTDMFVGLAPRDTWRFGSKPALVEALRARLTRIPGAQFAFTQPIALRLDEMVSGSKAQVAIKIFGPDLDALKTTGDAIAGAVRDLDGAVDVAVQQVEGFGYLEVAVRRAAAARYGLTVAAVQRALRVAVGGAVATEVLEGDRRFALVGRFRAEARATAEAVRDVSLRAPSGATLRLRDVADVRLTYGPAQIAREGGKRKLTVESNVAGRDIGGFVAEAQAAVAREVTLPTGYFLDWGGQFANQQRASRRLMVILPVTLALVFVLLYLTFGALRQAALVFLNVPVALVGGVVALAAGGLYMSVPASVGFIAVLGIAVQNGIVMVSFIDARRRQGAPLAEAVRTGALLRLRPILMTTLTTLLGLLPLLFAVGIGANVQRPLAAVVVGGLFTLVPSTLLLVPTLYAALAPEADPTPEVVRELEAAAAT